MNPATSCLLGTLSALLAGCAVADAAIAGERGGPPGPGMQRPGPGGHSLTLSVAGLDRRYLVHAPPNYDGRTPVPVVVMFHGGGGTGRGAMQESGWAAKADREGFLAVFPEAMPPDPTKPARFGTNGQAWNDGSGRFHAGRKDIPDVAFADAMIDDLIARFNVDRRRVFATGFSNGASMAFRAGAELPGRIAAIAPVAGALWVRPRSLGWPVPLYYVTGDADPLNPLDGGVPRFAMGAASPDMASRAKPAVREQVATWARLLGCRAGPEPAPAPPGVETLVYGGGRDGSEVRCTIVKGHGHVWPGGRSLLPEAWVGKASDTFNATDAVWRFFGKHPMPEPTTASPAGMEEARRYSEAHGGLSMLVMRDGRIVFEAYGNGGGPERRQMLASGTKSFVGVAALAAIEDGFIRLDDQACGSLTEWKDDPLKSQITYRQLLTLTSGLLPGERGSAVRSPAWKEIVGKPMAGTPGGRFGYGAYHLVAFCEALERKLGGETFEAYLERRVLGPLGIGVEWSLRCADGRPQVGGGARMTARDWAVFGEFVRKDGWWNGRQLIRADLFRQLVEGTPRNPAYGLTWWLREPVPEAIIQQVPILQRDMGDIVKSDWLPEDLFMAAGAGKQRLFVIPSMNLVVVRQGDLMKSRGFSDAAFLDLLLDRTPPPSAVARHDRNRDGFIEANELRGGGAPAAHDIVRTPDIRYAKAPPGVDPNLLSLDLHAPKGATNLPVMIYIHGGGWRRGDKAAVGRKADYFASQGHVFASLNYRLVPDVGILAQLQDSANAIGWIHRNIAQHGGDPARLHLIGHSAGAHHVAILATNGRFLGTAGVPFAALKSAVALDTQALDVPRVMREGATPIYRHAFGDDPGTWREVSPIHHVAPDRHIPPFLLAIAAGRGTKPAQADAFQKALQAAGVRCEVVEAPQHDHGSLNRAIGDKEDQVTQALEQFHDPILNAKKSAAVKLSREAAGA